jgi:hypothetical protein
MEISAAIHLPKQPPQDAHYYWCANCRVCFCHHDDNEPLACEEWCNCDDCVGVDDKG